MGLKDIFRKDGTDHAEARCADLQRRLEAAEQELEDAQQALGYAAAANAGAKDSELIAARARVRDATDRIEELDAGLQVAEQALAEARGRDAAQDATRLGQAASKAAERRLLAGGELDRAVSALGKTYTEFRSASEAADAAARAANPQAPRLSVYTQRALLLSAIWSQAPEVARVLELPYPRRGAAGQRPIADALSQGMPGSPIAAPPNTTLTKGSAATA